ncbi:hypothetical protein MIR68_010100 [Amoeboaphelidium protococcarum]|nr:hypothetical protein MIR68_010100 [Amoeboaphelidium protococcarum]
MDKQVEQQVQFAVVNLPKDTGCLRYKENYFSTQKAKQSYENFQRDLPWTTQDITLFGKTYQQPRLICLLTSDEVSKSPKSGNGRDYYSSLPFVSWSSYPMVEEIARQIERDIKLPAGYFNVALCNLYRDGKDSMGWHADDEKRHGPSPTIASLSFGDARRFLIKPKSKSHVTSDYKYEYVLGHGDLLVMEGQCQDHWQHSIPKTAKLVGPRLNITFRKILY